MWFTSENSIGRISTSGIISQYSTSPGFSQTPTNNYGIATGSDGNLWFTELFGNKIGRITPSGVITEYPIPTGYAAPWDIAAGPDGALWFTESGSLVPPSQGRPQVAKIGRITTTGQMTEWSLMPAIPLSAPSTYPQGITAGPDGALWFVEANTGTIGRITTAGLITRFSTAALRINSAPTSIASGPDGALWFTETQNGNKIGRITTAGQINEYAIPTALSEPSGITAGPDGAVWFTEEFGNKLGRITTAGQISEYAINIGPTGIAAGPDGALWLAGGNIAHAVLTPLTTIAAVTSAADANIQTIQSNSWVSIYGSNLGPAGSGRTWGEQDIINGRLPVSLDGVSVTVNGGSAFVEYISPTQINVLAPDDNASGTVNVIVVTNGIAITPFEAELQTYVPAFFTLGPPNQKYISAVFAPDAGGYVTYVAPVGTFGVSVPSRPAKAGDIAELYGTGFGPTNPKPPVGQVFFGAFPAMGAVTVTVGGVNADVIWAGVSSPGLWQLNLTIPPGIPDGDAEVIATVGGVQSQDGVFVPVQQ